MILQDVLVYSGSWKYNLYFPVVEGAWNFFLNSQIHVFGRKLPFKAILNNHKFSTILVISQYLLKKTLF